jgi:hypothetical protein
VTSWIGGSTQRDATEGLSTGYFEGGGSVCLWIEPKIIRRESPRDTHSDLANPAMPMIWKKIRIGRKPSNLRKARSKLSGL